MRLFGFVAGTASLAFLAAWHWRRRNFAAVAVVAGCIAFLAMVAYG